MQEEPFGPAKDKNVTKYFFKGFKLLNNNLELYLISLLLFIPIFLSPLLSPYVRALKILPLNLFLGVISLILPFFLLGYTLSIPIFYKDTLEGTPDSTERMWLIVKQSTKRLVFPVILLAIIVPFFLLFAGIIAVTVFHIQGKNIGQTLLAFNSFSPVPLLITGVFEILFSFLSFTSIYWSIEKIGIISSMKKSIIFGLRNINFVCILSIVIISFLLLTNLFFLLSIDKVFASYMQLVVTTYSGLGITASAYLFYRDTT